MRPGLHIIVDRVAEVGKAIEQLVGQRVAVGYPASGPDREDGSDLTNAAIAYINTKGAPEAGIPARPFLEPGIRKAQGEITKRLGQAAQGALDGNKGAVERGLMAAGLAAEVAAQAIIQGGIPPPLATSTIYGRMRQRGTKSRRRGEWAEIAARTHVGIASLDVKPLFNTGDLIWHLTFVLRKAPGARR